MYIEGIDGTCSDMTRAAILSFVRDYFVRENSTPSVRAIAEAVPGVDRASFYDFFSSKNELLDALGIEVEENDLPQVAAMEAKKRTAEKEDGYLVTLNRGQSEKLIALAYMEGKTVPVIVDEILEDQRQVRQVMLEVNEGILTSDIIDAILNPDLVYKGYNVSDIAGKPWFMLNCNRCGSDIFLSEESDFNKWLFEVLPVIKRVFTRITCGDCQPKPHNIVQTPVR